MEEYYGAPLENLSWSVLGFLVVWTLIIFPPIASLYGPANALLVF